MQNCPIRKKVMLYTKQNKRKQNARIRFRWVCSLIENPTLIVIMDVDIDMDTSFSQDDDYSNQDYDNSTEEVSFEYYDPTLEEESLLAIKQFAIGK